MIIKLKDQEIEIKKLPLRKFADLLLALQELPKKYDQFKDFDQTDNAKLIAMIPQLIHDCYPDVVGILTIATPLTKEQIESDEFGLEEFADCLIAVVEVNNFRGVFSKVKKAMARFRAQEQPTVPQQQLKP